MWIYSKVFRGSVLYQKKIIDFLGILPYKNNTQVYCLLVLLENNN